MNVLQQLLLFFKAANTTDCVSAFFLYVHTASRTLQETMLRHVVFREEKQVVNLWALCLNIPGRLMKDGRGGEGGQIVYREHLDW